MDQFEERIRALRDELNRVEQPDTQELWARLQKRKSHMAFRRYVWSAAAAVLLLLTATWIIQQSGNAPESDKLTISELAPEQQLTIQRYRQLVEDKENTLDLTDADSFTYSEWMTELKTMEYHQQQFSDDLATLPKDDRCAETLIRFYEHKIRIIELFSKKIQIQKNEKERLAQERI